jgi:hypothetical protein
VALVSCPQLVQLPLHPVKPGDDRRDLVVAHTPRYLPIRNWQYTS